jgi:DNA-binding MurR/RpiR family transcriptional regulator
MEEKKDLIYKINSFFKKMSKGQKLIANYILNHYDKAAFMTASKLGEKVGVSESTVVRFANVLGYEGYPQLQKALQELIRNKLTLIQRIEMTSDLDQSMVLQSVLKADINNIKMTLSEIDINTFLTVVDKIFSAKRIYVLGIRSSAPLAQFFGYYLNFIFPNVKIVTSGISDVFEQLMRITPDDILIGISFPRYSRRTVEALSFVKNKGAKVVAITDSLLSPLTSHADYTLIARSNISSFVDSMVAPASLINALLIALGLQKKNEIYSYFHDLEEIWDQYKVYLGKDKP